MSVVERPTLGILYSSTAVAAGGLLEGRVRTTDGRLDMVLAKPKELRGRGTGPGSDPEHLLAAAYSAGFLAALVAARPQDDPQFPVDAAVQATVAFGLARMEVSDWKSRSRSDYRDSRERTPKL